MTKEAVQKRIDELDIKHANAQALVHALNGARNELRGWIKYMEQEEQKAAESKPACS